MAKAATKTKPETETQEDVKVAPPTPTEAIAPTNEDEGEVVIPKGLTDDEPQPSADRLLVNINVINIAGNVGADPDIRYFDSGKVKCTFSLAVHSSSDKPDWFNIELWGKQAETAYNYVRKGSAIGIQGHLKIDTWQDRTTGAMRSRPIVKCDRLSLLAKPPSQRGQTDNHYEQAA